MRSVKRFGTKVATAALAAAMVPVVATGTAQAQGGSINYTKATADKKVVQTPLNDGRLIVSVWSDSMQQEVPNIVQAPRDGNDKAPVLYLVNGAGGGEGRGQQIRRIAGNVHGRRPVRAADDPHRGVQQ